jgi:hypothetical protein
MRSTFDFCIPTRATSVPNTPDWLHEIKYDDTGCGSVFNRPGMAS